MMHETTTTAITAAPDDETQAALVAVYALAEDAGYHMTRETVKLAEFASPTGGILYIEKVRISLNQIRCCVHPDHARESLLRMDGVETVSEAH